MPSKQALKSSRKQFIVNRVKQSILGLANVADADIDAKLKEIEDGLEPTFGREQAEEIVAEAVDAADAVITGAIQASVTESVKEATKK